MELFNEHINIVERSSGKKPLSQGNSSDAPQDEMTVKEIISVYRNHLAFEKCMCPLKINFICHTQAQVTLIK